MCTSPVTQIRSGKRDMYLDEPAFSIGNLPQKEVGPLYFSWRVVGPWLVISTALCSCLTGLWQKGLVWRECLGPRAQVGTQEGRR